MDFDQAYSLDKYLSHKQASNPIREWLVTGSSHVTSAHIVPAGLCCAARVYRKVNLSPPITSSRSLLALCMLTIREQVSNPVPCGSACILHPDCVLSSATGSDCLVPVGSQEQWQQSVLFGMPLRFLCTPGFKLFCNKHCVPLSLICNQFPE